MNTFELGENLPTKFKDDNEKQIAFEQYKLLVDTINNLHTVREYSNMFWIPMNVAAVSALASIKDLEIVSNQHKHVLLWTIIFMGFSICFSWLTYLVNLKKSIDIRNKLLIVLEKYFPIPLFTHILLHQNNSRKSNLTLTQMLVPSLFLGAYTFFAILLIFFTPEIIANCG